MSDLFESGEWETIQPYEWFSRWFGEAQREMGIYGDAFALATVAADGQPGLRMVLVRQIDERGFVFFTNYHSRKAHDLEFNPRAALLAWWREGQRQVRIEGECEQVESAVSDGYFATRPRESQIGAWASKQSAVIEGRQTLEAQVVEQSLRFKGSNVPRPGFWGGYRLKPKAFEFWQGRSARLHDRVRFDAEKPGEWRRQLLAP